MEAIERFREQIRAGEFPIGAGITFSDPLVSDALADSVDFLWIELEHSAMSPEALHGHFLAARARNVPALVRVADGSIAIIKPVLDAGADGIIVPQVRNVDEVRELVNHCRYPPKGTRGFGPRVPSNYYRDGGREFIERANQNVFVAIMVETAEVLEAIDDILAVPGLDSIVIGPSDLSIALGTRGELEHPTMVSAFDTLISKARGAGVFVGSGMGPDPEFAYRMAQRGIQWLQVGQDCSYLVKYMDFITSSIRSSLIGEAEN